MEKKVLMQLIERATEKASELQVPITVCIVDQGGHLLALLRQDHCSYFGIEASRKKAVTASQLKIPTQMLGTITSQFPNLKGALDSNPEIELLPGGFPLIVGGEVVGGLGVSGGNFEQDHQIGEYAAVAHNPVD